MDTRPTWDLKQDPGGYQESTVQLQFLSCTKPKHYKLTEYSEETLSQCRRYQIMLNAPFKYKYSISYVFSSLVTISLATCLFFMAIAWFSHFPLLDSWKNTKERKQSTAKPRRSYTTPALITERYFQELVDAPLSPLSEWQFPVKAAVLSAVLWAT